MCQKLSLAEIGLKDPEAGDVVVRVQHSGISTGTGKIALVWCDAAVSWFGLSVGAGYEAVGEVVDATAGTGHKVGDFVFVPGSSGFREAKGLFGGSASYLVTPADRVRKINPALGDSGTLFALAATARHALAGFDARLPELIIGHGVLGLLARLTVVAGGKPPTVWEVDENRMSGTQGYQVVHPDQDTKRDYRIDLRCIRLHRFARSMDSTLWSRCRNCVGWILFRSHQFCFPSMRLCAK